MKSLLLAMMLLPSVVFASDYARSYNGQIFKAENTVVCEAEFRRITNMIENLDGYTVLDGNCFALNDKRVQLRFNYIAPIASDVERFRYEFRTKAACEMQAKLGALAVSNSKNLFVASFCEGRRYVMDYIDRTYSVVRNLNMNAYFTDLNSCMTEVKNLTKALEKNSMSPIIKYCRPFKSVTGDKTYYEAEMVYSAVYNREMRVISGRSVDGVCFDQEIAVERTFSDAGVSIAHKFCSQGSKYSSAREYIMYLDDTQVFEKKVKLYQGATYTTQAECTMQMNDIIAKFRGLKRAAVYSYCTKLRKDMFRPNVHYVQNR